jgi:hypothetical protein
MFPESDQQYLDIPSWSGMVVFLRLLTKTLSCVIAKRGTILDLVVS